MCPEFGCQDLTQLKSTVQVRRERTENTDDAAPQQ